MNAIILDAGAPDALHPITCTRPLASCPVGNRPLLDRQRGALDAAGLTVLARPSPGLCLWVNGDSWLSRELLAAIAEAGEPCVVRGQDGYALAWVNGEAGVPEAARAREADAGTFRIRYPWDLLKLNELLVGGLSHSVVRGEVSPRAEIQGIVEIGEGSRVLPGVFIEGNVIIGRACRVGPNCYVRGHTSIGDGARIGQAVEIKNSIIMAGAMVNHLSYCGDSIIGEKVNMGAGTIVSNYRHDGKPHRSHVDGRLVDTGRTKFGTVLGDGVHTGIHTGIYPGRKIWPGVCTRPGAMVQYDLMS